MNGEELAPRMADGRLLRATVYGPKDGDLIVFHNGTPGTRRLYPGQIEDVTGRGMRIVSISRPGYEGSDRHPGRSYADDAMDAAEVADALEADSFYVFGHSGGAVHALATAALLPQRVIAGAALAGFAPHDVPGRRWMEGTGAVNAIEFEALFAGDVEFEEHLRRQVGEVHAIKTRDDLVGAYGDLLCEADRDCLRGPFLDFQLAANNAVGKDEIWGWFDDSKAMVGDWGFDFGQIAVPVSIWHGTADRFVPVKESEWFAEQLPAARLHLLEGEGHISVTERYYGAILDELIAIGSR